MGRWRPEFNLKLTVRVVLLGLGDVVDDPQVVANAHELEATLNDVLPWYYAPVVSVLSDAAPTSSSTTARNVQEDDAAALKVKYDISYQVIHAGVDAHNDYISAIADAITVDTDIDEENPGNNHHFLVPIDKVSSKFEAVAMSESRMSQSAAAEHPLFDDTEVAILVASPNRRTLRRQLEILGKLPLIAAVEDAANAEVMQATYSFSRRSHGGTYVGQDGDVAGDTGTCARSWVGQRRVLVLDLGAATCEYGAPDEAPSNNVVPEGVFPSVYPAEKGGPDHWLFGPSKSSRVSATGSANKPLAPEHEVSRSPDLSTILHLKLSSLVVSATRTVLAPAVPASPGSGHVEELIVIPILVFRGEDSSKKAGSADGEDGTVVHLNDVVDIKKVLEAVKSMALPRQKVVVVGNIYAMSEHPQVAVALKNSVTKTSPLRGGSSDGRSNVQMFQESYVHSTRLLWEMKSIGGELLSSLLLTTQDLDTATRNKLAQTAEEKGAASIHSWQVEGVRILPVFVYNLVPGESLDEGTDGIENNNNSNARGKDRAARLFENHSPFAVGPEGDTVLVLQAKGSASDPSFERGEELRLPLRDSTQAVVAGLLRCLYGTIPPDRWFPMGRQDSTLDLSWAHGFHPFAPLGFGGSVPGQLLGDVAMRNAVVARAAAAAGFISTTARVLEDFAQAFAPSELVVGVSAAPLFVVGAATRPEWGQALKNVLEVTGLPTEGIADVLVEQELLCERKSSFEAMLSSLPREDLAQKLEDVEILRKESDTALDRTKSAVATGTKRLEWCQCTTQRMSNGSHMPWMVYLGVMLVSFYALARLFTTARRALLKYAGNPPGRPVAGW